MQDCKTVLIGYSGHGLVVCSAAIASGMKVQYYTDLEAKSNNPHKLQYLGNESSDDFDHFGQEYAFVLGIGNNNIRSKSGQQILNKGASFLNVIHPSAVVDEDFEQGTGNFIGKGALINAQVSIGNFVIINTGAIVEHECKIADGVHIAPGAVLLGNVIVGINSFVGANAVVKQGVKIGNNAIIGAGAVVLKDVKDNTTVVGNPAREI